MLGFEVGRFGQSQAGGVEGQQNGAMFQMVHTCDESIDFFLAENRWQGLGTLAIRHGLDDPRSRQSDRVEEP